MLQSIVIVPAAPVVTLESVKKFLRVYGTAFDDEVQEALDSAHREAEEYLQACIGEQTRRVYLSAFPTGPVLLPNGPVQEIVEVGYLTEASPPEAVVDEETYQLNLTTGELSLVLGGAWPQNPNLGPQSVWIDYLCAWSLESPAVPANILMAIKALTQVWYDRDNQTMSMIKKNALMMLDYARKGQGV